MNDSMAYPRAGFAPMVLPGWKTALSWICAAILALLFLVAGVWKITDAPGWAVRINELKVPHSLSLAAALGFGIAETVGAVLVLIPRFRRWGAIVTGVLLLAFMGYFALNYTALHGAECTCFPFVKRVVGPGFFAGDGALLVAAILAGVWSRPARDLRTAVLILGAVAVFAGVSYGVEAARQTGAKAPDHVTVDGHPYSLEQGKIFLFFFDPECLHCLDAAKRMSHYNWGGTRVVAIPIQQPQFAPGFLEDTKLKAVVTNDLQPLKQLFPFVSAPAGVALENGREKAPLTNFDGSEPGATLKRLGFVE